MVVNEMSKCVEAGGRPYHEAQTTYGRFRSNKSQINPQQTGVSSWVNEEGKDTLPRPNPHDHSGSNKQTSHTLC